MEKDKLSLLVDIETDGLNPKLIWLICTEVVETGERRAFTYNGLLNHQPLEEFLAYAKGFKRYIAHNGKSFDFRVLAKLVGWEREKEREVDTLVLSRLLNQQRPGGHSVAAWGEVLGVPKIEFEDFTALTEEMITYCWRDIELLKLIYLQLCKEAKNFSSTSVKLEHQVAEILQEMKEYGFKLNVPFTENLAAEIAEKKNKLEVELTTTHPKVPKFNREVSARLKKDGSYYDTYWKPLATSKTPEEQTRVLGELAGGNYSFVDWLTFNPGSRQQIIYQLLLKGWVPEKFTEPSKTHPNGQPKVDEDTLDELIDLFPQAKDLITYLMLGKRLAQVTSWLELVGEDGRMHSDVYHIGARTHRASHSNPNQAQIPAVRHSPDGSILLGMEGTYNFECRSCWVAEEGYKIVGVDADAIQLVILAHAMDDEAFTEAVARGDKKKGTDVHSFNRNLLREIACELTGKTLEEVSAFISRDTAKTFDNI